MMPQQVPHYQEMKKIFESFRYKHDIYTVFEDFLYMGAACIANRYDFVHYEEREAEYMRRIKKYGKEDADKFPKLFAELVMCLETAPNDYLGTLFMDLGLGNKWKGQFFTPYSVSVLMAKMTIPSTKEALMAQIEANGGYITMNEPTVGGGAMVIAMFEAMLELDVNPQMYLRVVSQDIDQRAVLMTFIQTALLGIDNTVILGDTLKNECRETWRTPGRFLKLLRYTISTKDLDVQEEVTSEMLDEVEGIEYIIKSNGQLEIPF